MSLGEDRLKGFKPTQIKLKIENAILSKNDMDRKTKEVAEAIKKSNTTMEVIEKVAKILGIGIKALICLGFCLSIIGCSQAPAPVKEVHTDTAKIFTHFVKNMENVESGWEEAYRTESNIRLEENFQDAFRENTDKDGKILAEKAHELYNVKQTKKTDIEKKIEKARSDFEKAKEEAIMALQLHSSVTQWLERKILTAEDLQGLFDIAKLTIGMKNE